MDLLQPVYTEIAECQDCYKCLRECKVKAICIQDGHARIIPEACIQCGHCVRICPVNAKKVRNDLERVRLLLKLKEKTFVSLAPSYVAEFPEYSGQQIIAALRALGFAGVSHTALGAQEVSAAVSKEINNKPGLYLSSACPVITDMVQKYYPELKDNITDIYSPLLAHSKMLRREYGDDIGIVFIGPCIAKKNESDANKDLLNAAITFNALRQWWQAEGIDPAKMDLTSEEEFIPRAASEGAIYPVDGGMIAGIKADCAVSNTDYMTFSGLKAVMHALAGLEEQKYDRSVFVELLACEGGCVNGPGSASCEGTVTKRRKILDSVEIKNEEIPRKPTIDIHCSYCTSPIIETQFTEDDIRRALAMIGKTSIRDELNCGGCGYDSCRAFAKALLADKAEKNMCVGYMRKLADKKVDALISTMPSGVVIVDRDLCVVESNKKFAELLGEEIVAVFEMCPGLTGAKLEKIVPFYDGFKTVFERELEKLQKTIKHDGKVLDITIFTVEPKMLVGAIVKDVTEPAIQKEEILEKAQEVIDKNLETVQKIAFLLGENAAESEVILDSIKNMFKASPGND